jgi:lantibiotic leader peptide-processing serine protease
MAANRTLLTVGIVLAVALAGCADRDATAPASPVDPLAPPAPEASVLGTAGSSVVVFADESVPDAGLDLIASLGGTLTSRFDDIGVVFVAGLGGLARAQLRASSLVDDAGPDYVLNWIPDLHLGDVVAVEDDGGAAGHDPTAAGRFRSWQWGPQRIEADRAWAAGHHGDAAIRVAILDTGIDPMNRELRGLIDEAASRSFIPEEPLFDDYHMHGTHVASSVVTNSVTISGVTPHATLVAVKVLSMLGSGSFEGVIGGIMHAVDVDAHVINMSLGAVFDKKLEGADALIKATRRAVQHAERNGTIVISAAGNAAIDFDNAGTLVTMPCMVSHLCVSATGPLGGEFDEDGPILTENHDQPAWYTNYGLRAIHVAAPGGNFIPGEGAVRSEDMIVGACAGRSTVFPQCAVNNDLVAFYVFAAGTSMAAPHVSGQAALIQAAHGGSLDVDDLVRIITRTADRVGESGRDPYYNWGRINVMAAVSR